MRTRLTLALLCSAAIAPLHAQAGMFAATRNARATVQKATATNNANIAAANAVGAPAAPSRPATPTPAQTPASRSAASIHRATGTHVGHQVADTARATTGSAVFGTMKGGKVDTNKVITIRRESFQYTAAGHRDPFVSLLATSDIRPVIGDLRIAGIAYDPHGGNSVVILRDVGTKEQYRGKVGSQVGRMRIVRIEPKAVTFMIEEFGFSRQETLTMNDTTVTRTP